MINVKKILLRVDFNVPVLSDKNTKKNSGGDTIAFLEKEGLIDRFNYISTGGGAMLEFLAGNKLPGLITLEYVG